MERLWLGLRFFRRKPALAARPMQEWSWSDVIEDEFGQRGRAIADTSTD
jgi:hypothetical protein